MVVLLTVVYSMYCRVFFPGNFHCVLYSLTYALSGCTDSGLVFISLGNAIRTASDKIKWLSSSLIGEIIGQQYLYVCVTEFHVNVHESTMRAVTCPFASNYHKNLNHYPFNKNMYLYHSCGNQLGFSIFT